MWIFLVSIDIPEAERSSSERSQRPKSVLINQSSAWVSSPSLPQLLAKQMDSAGLMRVEEVEATNTFNDLNRPKALAPAQSERSRTCSGQRYLMDEDALVLANLQPSAVVSWGGETGHTLKSQHHWGLSETWVVPYVKWCLESVKWQRRQTAIQELDHVSQSYWNIIPLLVFMA